MNDQKNNENTDKNAFFSIRREDLKEDGEYFYIRANSAGLKKYAEKLNKLATEIEEYSSKTKISLQNDSWIKGDISLDFVEVVDEIPTSEEIISEPDQTYQPHSKWQDIGCGAVIIFLIVAVIIGIATIIKWI